LKRLALEDMVLAHGAHPVLAGGSVMLRSGDVALLLGENGTGKTTLLECLVGRLPLDSGRCLCDEATVVLEHTSWRSRLAYCPASDGTVPFLTVDEHLSLAALLVAGPAPTRRAREAAGMSHTAALDRAERLADLWGLQGHRSHRASELSDGLRKRLSLALMLVSPAELYLLDEPTLSLDAEGVTLLNETLHAIRGSDSAAIVTTHAISDLAGSATRRWQLVRGAVGQSGEVGEPGPGDSGRTDSGGSILSDTDSEVTSTGSPPDSGRFAWLFG
jgi:ABC-type multidrug transport system ATPase subunit